MHNIHCFLGPAKDRGQEEAGGRPGPRVGGGCGGRVGRGRGGVTSVTCLT